VDKVDHRAGEQWEFRCDAAGLWRWRWRAHDGGMKAASAASFQSLRAAMQDASRNGFSYTVAARRW
jgi:hypothetical protein